MNQGEIQREQKGWTVTAAVKGMAVPLVLSVFAHLVIGVVIVMALVGRSLPPDMTSTASAPILVDLTFVEAPNVPPPVPEQPVVKEHEADPETAAVSSEEREAVVPPDVTSTRDLWRPLDPTKTRAADLEWLMKVAECPRFSDPAQRDLETNCAGREPGLEPVDEVRQAKVAAKLAKGRDRQALRHGWVVASLPKPPDQMSAALEASKKTPGEEVFGPWPWDAGR